MNGERTYCAAEHAGPIKLKKNSTATKKKMDYECFPEKIYTGCILCLCYKKYLLIYQKNIDILSQCLIFAYLERIYESFERLKFPAWPC